MVLVFWQIFDNIFASNCLAFENFNLWVVLENIYYMIIVLINAKKKIYIPFQIRKKSLSVYVPCVPLNTLSTTNIQGFIFYHDMHVCVFPTFYNLKRIKYVLIIECYFRLFLWLIYIYINYSRNFWHIRSAIRYCNNLKTYLYTDYACLL